MVVKVMVSFPEEFLAEVDRTAQEEQRTRSELLREAMRFYIQNRRERQARIQAIAEHPADYDAEVKAWEAASDEALTIFDRSLAKPVKRSLEQQAKIAKAIAIMDKLSKISPGRGEDSTEFIRYWRQKRRVE